MVKNNCICGVCNKEFHLKPSAVKKGAGKYCSHKCYTQAQKERGTFLGKRFIGSGKSHPLWQHKRTLIKCLTCKKEITTTASRKDKKYCSKNCNFPNRNTLLTCLACGIAFKDSHKNRKYCSKKCTTQEQLGKPPANKNPKLHIKKTCQNCNKEFVFKAYLGRIKKGWGKFCSRSCVARYYIYKNKPYLKLVGKKPPNYEGLTRICPLCKEEFSVRRNQINKSKNKVCCSKKCSNLYKVGFYRQEKSYYWKGGRLNLKERIRKGIEYRNWRLAIYKRDGYKCVKCGDAKGHNLNADHYPLSFSHILTINNITTFEQALKCQQLWDINNGRTLCEPCHKMTPSYLQPLNKHYMIET